MIESIFPSSISSRYFGQLEIFLIPKKYFNIKISSNIQFANSFDQFAFSPLSAWDKRRKKLIGSWKYMLKDLLAPRAPNCGKIRPWNSSGPSKSERWRFSSNVVPIRRFLSAEIEFHQKFGIGLSTTEMSRQTRSLHNAHSNIRYLLAFLIAFLVRQSDAVKMKLLSIGWIGKSLVRFCLRFTEAHPIRKIWIMQKTRSRLPAYPLPSIFVNIQYRYFLSQFNAFDLGNRVIREANANWRSPLTIMKLRSGRDNINHVKIFPIITGGNRASKCTCSDFSGDFIITIIVEWLLYPEIIM
jgi:hypothetical protein